MAGPIYVDRTQETTTTSGTGTYTLAGAVASYQSFAAVGNGNTCYYGVTDGNDWEVGLGTYTASGTTLARTAVLGSSNGGAAVSWSGATKNIWVDSPALFFTGLVTSAGAFSPTAGDGKALGSTSLTWSDLFLADGGVINWNAGDATLTHSTGLLTSNVPFSVGTSNAVTVGTVELGAATDTTLSRSAAGVLAVEGNLVPSPASQATGDILYRGASSWNRLAVDSDGKVLTLASGLPSWGAKGGLTFLGTITTTSGSTQTLSGLTLTNYKFLRLMWNAVSSSGLAAFSIDGITLYTLSGASASTVTGMVVIDLATGLATTTGGLTTGASGSVTVSGGGITSRSTASTSISVVSGTGNFDNGSIRVYGEA